MLIDELNFKNQNFERNIEYWEKISNFYAFAIKKILFTIYSIK